MPTSCNISYLHCCYCCLLFFALFCASPVFCFAHFLLPCTRSSFDGGPACAQLCRAALHTAHVFVIAHLPAELMACRPTELPTYACPALFVSLFSFFALHSPLFVHLLLLAAPPLILHWSFLPPLHPIVAHNVRSLVQWLFNRLLFSAFDSDFFPIIAILLFRRVASLLLQFFPCLVLFSVEVAHAQPVDASQFLESLTGSLVV